MKYLIFRNDGIGDLIVSTCGIGQLRTIDKKGIEEVLKEIGTSDFEKYAVEPGTKLFEDLYLD